MNFRPFDRLPVLEWSRWWDKTTCIALLLSTLSVLAAPLTNLVTDCSFETSLPLWFEENGYGTYYATKEL